MRRVERTWEIPVLAAALLLGACRNAGSTLPSGRSPFPPVPSLAAQSLGPSQPPLIWLGGTLTAVTADHLEITEAFGSVVRLARLGDGATAFFQVQAGAWHRLDATTPIGTGAAVCAETLMDGTNLLALRVFLGAECGPA